MVAAANDRRFRKSRRAARRYFRPQGHDQPHAQVCPRTPGEQGSPARLAKPSGRPRDADAAREHGVFRYLAHFRHLLRASMVHFTPKADPTKAHYRRYTNQVVHRNDDFRAMEEVVGRRYRRLHDEGPNLSRSRCHRRRKKGCGQVSSALASLFLAKAWSQPAAHRLGQARGKTIIFVRRTPPALSSLQATTRPVCSFNRIRVRAPPLCLTPSNAELAQSPSERDHPEATSRGLCLTCGGCALWAHFKTLDPASKPQFRQGASCGPRVSGPKLAGKPSFFPSLHIPPLPKPPTRYAHLEISFRQCSGQDRERLLASRSRSNIVQNSSHNLLIRLNDLRICATVNEHTHRGKILW